MTQIFFDKVLGPQPASEDLSVLDDRLDIPMSLGKDEGGKKFSEDELGAAEIRREKIIAAATCLRKREDYKEILVLS